LDTAPSTSDRVASAGIVLTLLGAASFAVSDFVSEDIPFLWDAMSFGGALLFMGAAPLAFVASIIALRRPSRRRRVVALVAAVLATLSVLVIVMLLRYVAAGGSGN
jgi:hypothetical protein